MATKDLPSLQSGLESAYRRQQWPPNLMKNYSFIPRRHAYSSLKTCRALIVTSSRIGHTTLSSSSSSPHRISCIDFLVSYLVGIVCERCDLFCQTVQCHHVWASIVAMRCVVGCKVEPRTIGSSWVATKKKPNQRRIKLDDSVRGPFFCAWTDRASVKKIRSGDMTEAAALSDPTPHGAYTHARRAWEIPSKAVTKMHWSATYLPPVEAWEEISELPPLSDDVVVVIVICRWWEFLTGRFVQ